LAFFKAGEDSIQKRNKGNWNVALGEGESKPALRGGKAGQEKGGQSRNEAGVVFKGGIRSERGLRSMRRGAKVITAGGNYQEKIQRGEGKVRGKIKQG